MGEWEDMPGYGSRVLRDARQRDRRDRQPVRVICSATRRRLWALHGPPDQGLAVDVAQQDPRAVRMRPGRQSWSDSDLGLAWWCDRCRTRHRVRLDRLAAAYTAAVAGDRVVRLPLADRP